MSRQVSVQLEDEIDAKLDELAKVSNRSRSSIVNEAVDFYAKERMAYLEELNQAIEDAKSGYGHSSDQIHSWMKSWGRSDEEPVPSPDIKP